MAEQKISAQAMLTEAFNRNFAIGLKPAVSDDYLAIVYAILLVGLDLCEAIAARDSAKGEQIERA